MSFTWHGWSDLYLANQHAANKRQRRTVRGWLQRLRLLP